MFLSSALLSYTQYVVRTLFICQMGNEQNQINVKQIAFLSGVRFRFSFNINSILSLTILECPVLSIDLMLQISHGKNRTTHLHFSNRGKLAFGFYFLANLIVITNNTRVTFERKKFVCKTPFSTISPLPFQSSLINDDIFLGWVSQHFSLYFLCIFCGYSVLTLSSDFSRV